MTKIYVTFLLLITLICFFPVYVRKRMLIIKGKKIKMLRAKMIFSKFISWIHPLDVCNALVLTCLTYMCLLLFSRELQDSFLNESGKLKIEFRTIIKKIKSQNKNIYKEYFMVIF